MAIGDALLRLIRTDEFGVSQEIVNVLNGSLRLIRWDRDVALADGTHEEAIQAAMTMATDRLAVVVSGQLDGVVKNAPMHKSLHHEYLYWLETRPYGGLLTLRALIDEFWYAQPHTTTTNGLQTREVGQGRFNIKLKRFEWERDQSELPKQAALTSSPVLIHATGTLPARINRLKIYKVEGATSTYWIGIKPARDNNSIVSHFVSTWKAHLGTWENHTVAITDPGDNEPPIKLPMNSGAGLVYRGCIRLEDVYSGIEHDDFRGSYRALIRAKAEGDSTTHMRLVIKVGVNQENAVKVGTFFVRADGWQTLEAAKRFDLPNLSNFADASWASFGRVGLHFFVEDLTERQLQTDVLYIDHAKLLSAEHYARVTTEIDITDNSQLHIMTHPNNRIEAIVTNAAGVVTDDNVEVSAENWHIPTQGGWLDVASDNAGDSATIIELTQTRRFAYRI